MESKSHSHHDEHIDERTHIKPEDEEKTDPYIVKPMGLKIIWGGDSRYWRLPHKDNIGGPVELLQVCWLEASGTIELKCLKPNTNYKISFELEMKADAFGWSETPLYLMVKVGSSEKYKWKRATLSGKPPLKKFIAPESSSLEFTSLNAGTTEKLYFGLYEIWKGRWKGGLVIHEVKIEPTAAAHTKKT